PRVALRRRGGRTAASSGPDRGRRLPPGRDRLRGGGAGAGRPVRPALPRRPGAGPRATPPPAPPPPPPRARLPPSRPAPPGRVRRWGCDAGGGGLLVPRPLRD